MALLRLVMLLSAGVLLRSTAAENPLSKLSDTFKKGVKLALREVNGFETLKQHFLFFDVIHQAKVEAGFDVTYIYNNFYLKATKCRRGTVNTDTSTCPFRNDRPLIDCVICYKMQSEKIVFEPKPYLNCVSRQALTKELQRAREVGCYRAGFGSLTPTPVSFSGS